MPKTKKSKKIISYDELRKHVNLMDVAAELGYKLDPRQGKKFIK